MIECYARFARSVAVGLIICPAKSLRLTVALMAMAMAMAMAMDRMRRVPLRTHDDSLWERIQV